MKRLHLFKGGTHTAMGGQSVSLSEAEIAGIVATYDVALHEAPIVVGHPKDDNPAYGWVRGLDAVGQDLFADVHQVPADFAELVRTGRFKKLSVSLYLPSSPAHPVRAAGGDPQFPYLRHVGMLGAMAPAIKGLRPAEFAAGDDEGVATIEFSEDELAFADAPAWTVRTLTKMLRAVRGWISELSGDEEAERVIPQSEIDYALESLAREEGREDERERQALLDESDLSPAFSEPSPPDTDPDAAMATDPKTDETPTDFAEREAQLEAREAELKTREAEIAGQEAKAKRAANLEFAESLVEDNARILPRHVHAVASVLDHLSGVAEGETVSFGEGDDAEDCAAADALKRVLGELGANVEFSEVSAPEARDKTTIEFAAPRGFSVDPGRAALHAKAKRYEAEHGVSFAEAVEAVS